MGIKFNIANNATRFSAAASAGASADHTRLSNRDAANQHPISAITGLAQALGNAGYDDTSIQQRISAIEEKESVWDAKYTKPVNGISRTDLSATVKTSLNKADSALQEIPEGYATESYVDNHHDSTKQDTLTPGDNITIEDGVISAAGGGAAFFVSTAGTWGVSGNTAKFDNIVAPASVPGDYIFYQGVLYIVTAHATNSTISVTKVGNAVEGATGAPYITANNAGWGISGDNRSFDRSQLNPNTPAVGSIVYSAAAGMYFKINSVGSGAVATTRIFKDFSPVTDAHINDLINAALSALDGNGVTY